MDCIIDTKIVCPDLIGALSAVVLAAEAIAGGKTPISRPAATAPMIGKRVISVFLSGGACPVLNLLAAQGMSSRTWWLACERNAQRKRFFSFSALCSRRDLCFESMPHWVGISA
jgi:hypothetical protein